MMLRYAAALWLAGAAAAAAQTDACQQPQTECAGMVTRECLTSFGAGVIVSSDETDCGAQMNAYRECLSQIVESCSVVQQDGGPTEAERYSYDQLASLGGLIGDPRSIVEYYNNAVVYARRGDALSARRMYEQAIALGADAVDIHQDYTLLLKAQEGLVGAREIYAGLARRQPDNLTARMFHATLLPENRREAALRALVAGDSGYAPAWWQISRLYSLDRLGDQSLADKRAEKAALEAFAAADQQGGVYRWFLQKDEAEEWREDARRRLAAYANRRVDVAPVTMTASPSNDSWTIVLLVNEAAREIRYSVDGGAVTDTGLTDYVDQRTGAPTPRNFISLPLRTEAAEIRVWYDDVRGQEQGPFTLAFEAAAAYTAFTRNILDNMTQQWIQGRDWDERYLVYFTHLISYRCGLDEIAYGVDRDEPDQTYPLEPCDPANPFAVGENATIYLSFDQRPERMVLRLTYADGAQSALREFRFDP